MNKFTFINANDYVKVRLTEAGKKYLDKFHPEDGKWLFKRPDRDNYYEIQLWHLMNVFGPIMHMGPPQPPFEMNLQVQSDEILELKKLREENAKLKEENYQLMTQRNNAVAMKDAWVIAHPIVVEHVKKLENIIKETHDVLETVQVIDRAEWQNQNEPHIALALHGISNTALRMQNQIKKLGIK